MLRRRSARGTQLRTLAPLLWPRSPHTAVPVPGGGQSTQLCLLRLNIYTRGDTATLPSAVTLFNAAVLRGFAEQTQHHRGKSCHQGSSGFSRAPRYGTETLVRQNWGELRAQGARSCWQGLRLRTTDPLKSTGLETNPWLHLPESTRSWRAHESPALCKGCTGWWKGCAESAQAAPGLGGIWPGVIFIAIFGILCQNLSQIKPLSINHNVLTGPGQKLTAGMWSV